MSTVMHGRREGQDRAGTLPKIGLAAKGINPREVAILQPKDWQRIHNSLTKYNRDAEVREARQLERTNLHEKSKELVKNWGNTIAGQRQKKLQARAIREEQEEEERKKIDIEEAKLQAAKRKEAIEHAKKQLYYQTDRVKNFHGALLLTEVIKERDAQVAMKRAKNNWQQDRDEHLLRLTKKEYDEAIKEDLEKANERFKEAQTTAKFQLLQLNDRRNKENQEVNQEIAEGKTIKRQCEQYEQARLELEKQKREEKNQLMETYNREIERKKDVKRHEEIKDEQEDQEIRKFVNAKRKMATMRKDKEQELFENFQQHTERMRTKLAAMQKTKVDNEDELIRKAVEERERKRIEAEMEKKKIYMDQQTLIHKHRVEAMEEAEAARFTQTAKDRALLSQRIEDDNKYQTHQEMLALENREKAKEMQQFHKNQVAVRVEGIHKEREKQLEFDTKNVEKLVEEEENFQKYADTVITDAKKGGRNPYPLIKAAREGPGGGRGPKLEGNAGLRPSYIVTDATGVQMPHYLRDADIYDSAYRHVGKSGKRLGFGW